MEDERYSYAAFLYQQAVEKALKYALLKKTGSLPKVHDCFILAEKLEAPELIKEKADTVTPYYFLTRYPDVEGEVTESEVRELREAATEIVEWITENY